MILIYSPTNNKTKIKEMITTLEERLYIFFIEHGDGIEIINERNQKMLRLIIDNTKPILFYVDSIKEMDMSPTVISELVLYLLKSNCEFQSESDNIYFTKDDINKIYPTIFDIFKDNS